MVLNILELIILAVTVLLALIGYFKGFVSKFASILSLVLSVALVSVILPYMTQLLQEHTPLYTNIVEQCDELLTKNTGGFLTEGIRLSRIQENELIENLSLPEQLKDKMLDYNNEEGYRKLNVTTFRDYITHYIANAVLNLFSFLAAFILANMILRVLFATLDIVSYIPMIGGLNRIVGLILGLMEALFLIWIFFLILSAAITTDWGLQLMAMVEESSFLSFLYHENLIMRLILWAPVFF